MVAWRTFCAARQLEAGQVAIVPASCQLSFQAGMRPAIRYGQAAISDQLPYQLSYVAVGSQEADLQWCGPRCGPGCGSLRFNLISIICTVTRVQTKGKTATRARGAKGRTTSGHHLISSTSRCNDKTLISAEWPRKVGWASWAMHGSPAKHTQQKQDTCRSQQTQGCARLRQPHMCSFVVRLKVG
jgi:hypothetical protein